MVTTAECDEGPCPLVTSGRDLKIFVPWVDLQDDFLFICGQDDTFTVDF